MGKITLGALLLFGGMAQAQLFLDTTTMTPAQLIQNVLVGPSVTPYNIKFNGTTARANILSDQTAHFLTQTTPTNLGIDSGLLMTTGKATVAYGPNGDDNASDPPATPITGDPDLALLTGTGNSIENSCVLEFDFVATGLELNFDYVFASEEYPEYSNTAFNDVFGFFLSGPGISGPYSLGARNIALVPSTSTAISINNVNNGSSNSGPCEYCSYYVNNGQGTTPAANPFIQYDGFTTVLRATSPLVCGQVYHIKLAVANVSDDFWDSAVFLKNFRIAPMELVDDLGQHDRLAVCYGQTLTIHSSMPPGSYLYSWTKDGIPVAGETGPDLDVTANGTYAITITTPAGCQLAYDEFQVNYLPAIAINVPLDITFCAPTASGPYTFPTIDQTTYVMSALDPALFPITYYDSTLSDIDALNGVGELTPADMINYVSNVPKTIYVRVDDLIGGCYIIKPFVLNANFAPPPVTAPVSFCQGAGASALTATGTGLLWYTAATGGVGSSTAPTPSTSATGNTTYYVTQTTASCESIRVPLVVSITPTPSAPVVSSPVSYCQNVAATALTATGSNLLWYAASTGGVGSVAAPTPNTAVLGSTTYYVSQSTGCEGPRSAIVVNVTAALPAPIVATPLSYCQGETTSALAATGSSLLWYAGPTGGVGNAVAPVPSSATTGSNTFYVSQTSGTCESPRAAITVNVLARPAAPAVAPVNYCQNNIASPLTAVGSNLLWYSASTGGAGSASAPTPATTTIGLSNFYVSQTVNGCESPRAILPVTIAAPPAAPAVAPVTYCQGSAAVSLTATGTNLQWYAAATGGAGSAAAPTPSTLAVGNTTYYVTQNNGCESARSALVVTVAPVPSAPASPSPLVYCQGETASALTATGANLLWYAVPSGGLGSSAVPVPSTSTSGSTTYYVTQNNGTCESVRTAVVVNVLARPAAPTVTAANYCQNDTAAALTATGANLLWYAGSAGGVGSPTAPTPSTMVAGTTNYYVTQTVNGCEGPRAALAITINAPPAVPAVSPLTYCQGDAALPLTGLGANLQWYAAATGGTGSAVAPTPSTTTSGSTTYYVTQSNGCESARSSLVVTIAPVPAAPAAPGPLLYCQGEAAPALTATGTNLLWYTASSGGLGSPAAPAPSTALSGSTTYFVSQNNGTCESARTAIIVNVLPRPPAPGVTALNYCRNDLSAALTATGANLLWYAAATGGLGSAAPPTPSTAIAGTTNYYVTQTVAGCESLRSLLAVIITAPPAAPSVTTPVSFCQGTPAVSLTAIGSNLLWYTTATGGTGSATAPVPSTTSTGNTTYYVSQSNGCEGPRSAITVNVIISLPAPGVTTPIVYCQGISASALTATGSNLIWYAAATGGPGSGTAPIPATSSPGNTTYYVSQSTANCESPRTAITINVLARPALPGTAALTYCRNTVAPPLSALGSNLLWYSAATGGAGSATAPTPGTSTSGTVNYYVSQTINGCEGPRALLPVIVTAPPAAPSVTPNFNYCQNQAVAALTAAGTNLMWYTAASGGTGSTVAPIPSTANGGTATYYVSQSNGCEGPRAAITVNVTSIPAAPSVISPVIYCEGDAANALTAIGSNLQWYTSPTGGTGAAAAPIPMTSIAGTKTYYVSSSNGNCEGPRAAIVVNVYEVPKPVLPQEGVICFNSITNTAISTYTLTSGLSGSQYTYQWFTSNGGSWDPVASATQSSYIVTTPGVYGVKVSLNGRCPSDIVTATVGMSSPPLEIKLLTSNYFEDAQMITVNVFPAGNYEYQLDNGAFQSSNIFQDLPSGTHHVSVRNNCGELGPVEAILINYPKFFTPNSDGYNDTWNIFSLRSQANSKIYIFDRYGKFLKEITPNGEGWDGTFNQQYLPSTDYWFQVYYEENSASKVFKSHFALKR